MTPWQRYRYYAARDKATKLRENVPGCLGIISAIIAIALFAILFWLLYYYVVEGRI